MMALNKGYTFLSAVKLHECHPDTFEIPSEEDREHIRPGWFAKLIFKPRVADGIVERMWVKVFRRIESEGVIYEGVLDNEPAFDLKRVLKWQDTVKFKPEHVADILKKQ